MAQDLIVTNEFDSINCKVLNQYKICEFSITTNNKVKTNIIALDKVRMIKIGYFKSELNELKVNIQEGRLINFKRQNSILHPIPKFRCSINGIYAYRYSLDDYSNNIVINTFTNRLKTNFGILTDAHVAIGKRKKTLMGFQYSRIQGNGNMNNVELIKQTPYYATISYYGNAELQVTIETFGINLLRQITNNINHKIYISVGLNYLKYYEDFRISNAYNLISESTTYATSLGLIYDYRINNNFAFGVGATVDGGIITNFSQEENGIKLPSNNELNGIGLGRLSFTSGLRYYL